MHLKTARKIAGLSQADLAARAGVKQETISQLENGRIQRVSYETVGRIARALNVSVEELFPLQQESA
jgi:putative transcriptional regulator